LTLRLRVEFGRRLEILLAHLEVRLLALTLIRADAVEAPSADPESTPILDDSPQDPAWAVLKRYPVARPKQ
jgi:hypothetical protein